MKPPGTPLSAGPEKLCAPLSIRMQVQKVAAVLEVEVRVDGGVCGGGDGAICSVKTTSPSTKQTKQEGMRSGGENKRRCGQQTTGVLAKPHVERKC